MVSDGLGEYEATDDGRVMVTLVRAVGELSRRDLPERPGHAGWPAATPEAQSPGAFEAGLALAVVGPRSPEVDAQVERIADDVLLPLTGDTLRSALAVPAPTPAIELLGDGLAFSAIKPSDDGEWVVLRCVNVTDRAVSGAWRIGTTVTDARLSRLDETPLTPIAVERGDDRASVVRCDVPARGVMTILVR